VRTLTSSLAAAAKADSRRPYVRAVVDDYDGDRPRLRFSRYYAGSEVEYFGAACVAPDGSLVRARVDAHVVADTFGQRVEHRPGARVLRGDPLPGLI